MHVYPPQSQIHLSPQDPGRITAAVLQSSRICSSLGHVVNSLIINRCKSYSCVVQSLLFQLHACCSSRTKCWNFNAVQRQGLSLSLSLNLYTLCTHTYLLLCGICLYCDCLGFTKSHIHTIPCHLL